jgi:hypothetical protein
MLVTGRSFGDADDVASVLHHRINRYVTGVGYPYPPSSELIAGIFPRPTKMTDPDVTLARNDRADDINRRDRDLATIAVERGDAWVQDFGDAPPSGELYERWFLDVTSGAAYLDRWGIDRSDTVIDDAVFSYEQETQRSRVLSAAQRARTLTLTWNVPVLQTYVLSGDERSITPNHDFGHEL